MFLAVVVVFRTRKTGSTSMLPYLTASFMYCKIANLILFFYADPRMALCYGVLCTLQLLLLPEPVYQGPDKVIYFRGPNIRDEINSDRRVVWLVAFYTAWSPACASLAPLFAELSSNYCLDNFKFGKLDVGRYAEVAKDFYIDTSSFSRQLPTMILYKNGKEVTRRPLLDSKGRIMKFYFSEDNIKAAFDLNALYQECKNNPLKDKKKAKEEVPKPTENADGKVKSE